MTDQELIDNLKKLDIDALYIRKKQVSEGIHGILPAFIEKAHKNQMVKNLNDEDKNIFFKSLATILTNLTFESDLIDTIIKEKTS